MRALDFIDRKINRLLAGLPHDHAGTRHCVGLSASPCARRVRLLEKRHDQGVRCGGGSGEIGLPISVFVSVKLERQREEELDLASRRWIVRWPEDSPTAT